MLAGSKEGTLGGILRHIGRETAPVSLQRVSFPSQSGSTTVIQQTCVPLAAVGGLAHGRSDFLRCSPYLARCDVAAVLLPICDC